METIVEIATLISRTKIVSTLPIRNGNINGALNIMRKSSVVVSTLPIRNGNLLYHLIQCMLFYYSKYLTYKEWKPSAGIATL